MSEQLWTVLDTRTGVCYGLYVEQWLAEMNTMYSEYDESLHRYVRVDRYRAIPAGESQ
jgi:hypothetical protein